MNNKFCIINTENPIITDKLKEYGYICIATEKSANVSEPISQHADVLYLKTGNKEIYVSDCQKNNIQALKDLGYSVKEISLSPGYKTESKLNMVVSDRTIICNPDTCIKHDFFIADKEVIQVKQGYTKCSTVILSDNDFITEDEGICKTLKSAEKNCLLIEKGFVSLEGYNYGFIGGASVFLKDENTILFFGDITLHKDYINIKDYCDRLSINIAYINNFTLSDIGGCIII